MDFNKPPQGATKDDVARKILEAQKAVEKPPQSFGALLDSIKQESAPVKSVEASSVQKEERVVEAPVAIPEKSPEEIAKEEKRKAEAREKIEDINKKLSVLRGKRELVDGGLEYAAVAKQEKIFGECARAQMEVDLETYRLKIEEMTIRQKAGLEVGNGFVDWDHEKGLEFFNREARQRELSLQNGYRGSKDYSDLIRKQLAGDGAISPSMIQTKIPEALPKAIRGYYEKEFENVKSFTIEAPKFQLNRMYGLALAALESGDTVVAAEALAFTESIQPMDREMTEKVGGLLSKMDALKRKSFSEQFDLYKNMQRNYMEEINNEREKRTLKDTPK